MSSKVKFFAILFLLNLASCKNHARSDGAFFEGYNRTESGLFYTFHVHGSGENVQHKDLVLASVKFYWCDAPIEMATNYFVLGPVEPSVFPGDLNEGLLMMRVGDSASFLISADSAVIHLGFIKSYVYHLCDFLRVTVFIDEVKPFDFEAYYEEREAARSELQAHLDAEQALLRNHLRRNNITVSPNNDGVYVIVTQRGTGARITANSTVIFDYTARLLCGRIVDSSCEDISFYAGLISPWRDYQPQEITVGEQRWITGLDNALIGQTVGSTLRLIMPSTASAGQRQFIMPHFQPLVLDIEILEMR